MRNRTLATTSAGLITLALNAAAQAACEPDFSGVTLDVGTRPAPFIASALRAAAESWEKQTCGTVNVLENANDRLYPIFLGALKAAEGPFDVITYGPFFTPDFAPYLTEMPPAMRETEAWQDIHPVYRERLMIWDGRYLSQTIDGDLHSLYYRTDLFGDAGEQAAFRKKHGYELGPPATWKQYYDIATFFTRPQVGLWGTAEPYRRGGEQFWFFFSHAASYTNHPDHPGSMFFDPETMDAQVNNPGWVRALEDYIHSLNVSPPGALGFASEDIHNIFAGGSVAMNFDWGDSGVTAADPEISLVNGHVGSALLPGSREIWNYKVGHWDRFDEPVRSPFMAFGGWQAAVPANSDSIEAAWHFVEWLSSPEISGRAVVTAGSGINPYRLSHFEIDPWLEIFTPEEARSYLDAQLGSLNAPNVALDMRLPGYFRYMQALEVQVTRALNFEIPPKEALDGVAAAWNALTDRFGRERQRAAYRASMGLD